MKKFLGAVFLAFLFPTIGLAADFDRDLYFGLKNDKEVSRLQEFLRDQALYSGAVTGNFFSLTREAVKKFQVREKIVPALGFFGPKSRALANLAQNKVQTVPELKAKIESLQAELQKLQKKLTEEQATSTITVPVVKPITFTKTPAISQKGFVSNPSLGARYPYRIVFDWATDAQGVIDESITCTPSLKIVKSAGRLNGSEYFPEPNKNYTCNISVKNDKGASVSADVSFSTPMWVSISGNDNISFPDVEKSSLKIGEIALYNGTTTDLLFTSFDILITDEMDSAANRNRRVAFLLKDGTTTTDAIISDTKFTFITAQPEPGKPYISPLSLPLPILLKSGEEKKVSLWMEQLAFVKSGTLKIQSTGVSSTATFGILGSFNFVLTKSPPL